MAAPPAIGPAGITIELGDGGLPAAAGTDGDGSPGSDVMEPVGPAPAASSMTAPPRAQAGQAIGAEVSREQSATLQPVAAVETAVAKPLPEPEPEQKLEPQAETQSKPKSTSASESSRVEPKQRPKPATAQPNDTKAATERMGRASEALQSANLQGQERAEDKAARGRPGVGEADGEQPAGANGYGKGGSGSEGGGGGQASTSNYYGRLATWLARHKRYPVQARRLRQEGTAKVTFTITRSGRVVSKRIVQSSGYELLDQEVQAMLERASPLPRIPSSLGRSRLTITLPVAFALR